MRFFLIFLFLGFYSCDKEAVSDDGIFENNKSFQQQGTFNEIEYRRETRMQWASFLIAQTLLRHPEAEEIFINTLTNSSKTNVIALSDLLGGNFINNTAFVDAFKSEFLYYYSNICRLNDDDPDGVPTNSNKPPPHTMMEIEDVYVWSLLNDPEEFEFELYLPNGYTRSTTGNQITSSAYSLGISVEDAQGYIHIDRCDAHSVNVTPTHRGNLIILKY
ncbi:hypothetical protein [Aquimarina litoralis]|uniref:hypothetical protein n=1 Tax=Aquimarina litoralis TaxID=584605 RepID=UPI001C5625AD|nr:hypothetical protein [Aquimarina litoralis]